MLSSTVVETNDAPFDLVLSGFLCIARSMLALADDDTFGIRTLVRAVVANSSGLGLEVSQMRSRMKKLSPDNIQCGGGSSTSISRKADEFNNNPLISHPQIITPFQQVISWQ